MRNIILQLMLSFLLLETLQVFGQKTKCAPLDSPAHGRVRLRARGRIAKFRCNRKFTLFGKKMIICSGDKWSYPPPICIRKGCDKIQSSGNLTVTDEKGGAVLEFKCAPPLKLTGAKMITCDGKTWSAEVPSCEYVEPENYCDFEDENICGWQHDKLANFEWKWNSGTTPTRRTGPKNDHTLGKGRNGHYMFMESSSPIETNEKARLLSPYFPATTGGLCFEIWYHMWGVAGYNQVGRLAIYIEEIGQTDTLSQKAEFDVSGNQGDEWIKGQFPVGEQKTSFRFIIEGTKLKSYLSDISVDDPKLYNCSDDYEDTIISTQETTAAETTEAVVQTTAPIILTKHQDRMTTQPVTTTEELIDLSTNVFSSSSAVKSTASSTELKTKAIKVSHVTTATMLPTTSKVAETTLRSHITTSPVKQSTIGITSESMTSKEVITKPLTSMKKTTIKQTRPTTRETTVSSTSAPSTKETTTTITSSKSKRKITSKPTTITTSTTRKPETSYVVTTTRPTTTTTKPIPTTTKNLKPTNKKTTPTTVKTPTTATLSTVTTKQTTNVPVLKTSKHVLIPSKSVSTELTTQEVLYSNKKSDIYTKNTTASSVSNLTTTQSSIEIVEPANRSDNTPIKPLMIGIGVGIAIGLIIVIGVIYTYLKKRRKDDVFEDEMEPIAKNAVYD